MWKDYIYALKKDYVGKKVLVDGKQYTIVDVDYNGILHIDKPSEHNKTTAMFSAADVQKFIIKEDLNYDKIDL